MVNVFFVKVKSVTRLYGEQNLSFVGETGVVLLYDDFYSATFVLFDLKREFLF